VDEGGSALATRSTAGASAWHGHEPGRRDQRFAGAGRSGARDSIRTGRADPPQLLVLERELDLVDLELVGERADLVSTTFSARTRATCARSARFGVMSTKVRTSPSIALRAVR
jgi:hypothetical protein